MLAKRIIPCLDVDNGRVVKGIRFVSLADAGDPVAQAKRYDLEGADELTFLDITASSDSREIVIELVRRVADEVFIPFTVGGGLRSVTDIRAILRAGADKVTLNTAALEKPELISADLILSRLSRTAVSGIPTVTKLLAFPAYISTSTSIRWASMPKTAAEQVPTSIGCRVAPLLAMTLI